MLCSRCGALIENKSARFCPVCGYKLNSYSTPVHGGYVPSVGSTSYPQHIYQTTNPKKNNSTKIAVVIIVLVLFIGIGISVSAFGDDHPERTEIQKITDDTYFEVSKDFLEEKNILSVALYSDDRIAFTLNPDLASNYSTYSWALYDHDHIASTSTTFFIPYSGDTITKAEPVLYLLSQKPGVYDVAVDCSTPSGQHTTYSGTVTYYGIVSQTYNWTYDGVDYSINLSFDYKDYLDYKNMNANGRSVSDYSKVVSFIKYDDPAIKDLTASLRNAYGTNKATTDQDYASFILAFVQWCFEYPPHTSIMGSDKYQYGMEEYFAYPLETIFYGMGDCEDTSILAAALFKAAGFDAGVVVLPGHAVATVGLNVYDSGYTPEELEKKKYEILYKTINDVTYYGCETTIDNHTFWGIGIVDGHPVDDQGRNSATGHQYSWYIGKMGYDFYIVS